MKTKILVVACALAIPTTTALAGSFDLSSVVRVVDGKCVQNGVVLQPDACKNAYTGEVKAPVAVKPATTDPTSQQKTATSVSSRYLAMLPSGGSGSADLKSQLKVAAQNVMTETASVAATDVKTKLAFTQNDKNTITHGVHVGADGTKYSRVCTTSSCLLAKEDSAKRLEIAQQLPSQTAKAGKTYEQYKKDHSAWQASMTQEQKVLASKGGAGIATPLAKDVFLRESHMESYLRGDVDTVAGTTAKASMPPTTQPVTSPTTPAKNVSTVTHGAHVGADGTKYSRVCTGASCLLAKEDSAKRLEIAQQLPSQTTKVGKSYDQYKKDHGAWQASMTQEQKALASKGGAGLAAPVAKETFLRESHMESYLRGM